MRPYLDNICSFLEDEFDINPDNSDLSVKLLALVQDEESRGRIVEKSSNALENKENDVEPTGSQLNFIKSSEFSTVEIEELIIEMDEESKRELTNASDGINRTYQNEQEGSQENLEAESNIASKKQTVEAQPVRNLDSSSTKAPAI
ncbi:hypothetical protein [Vibrio hepatarius]|uniref:hypothetical protein n=1 Tax=Vibrio hepatarius TaxID=171383 RepID=UPI001C096411|nr:hypothetical protein [Vibrio hepatarius]MBU2899382.1 hypothetical protein [Vibrio hepatarius]